MNTKKIIASALVVLAVELGIITATVVYIAVNGVTMAVDIEQLEEAIEVVAEDQQTENE